MAVLTSQQRNTLESAVKQARKIAETGAFNALHGLAIDNPEPFAHMGPDQKALRNSLRSKARLLGDELPANGAQEIDHLTYELAYETWHKMLFAKFLESNGLLMHPDGVAITMEDCEELAKEEGFFDKWDVAANYASKMLPAIFRTDDPLMQISFATEERIKLEEIISGIENQIFTAEDSLGWVYQYWQSEAKKKVEEEEKRGQKVNGDRLPAKTQLFTEPYMVQYLIDNTIGAWWVSRNPGVEPPIKFEYLRLLDNGSPASGEFQAWPTTTAEITSLDPCMGSGHFVASLFLVFASLRIWEEGLTKEEAIDKVIVENLFGLELDARCTQIAAFNLALNAWKFCGHYKVLPEMNLACSGIAPKGKVEDWIKLVGNVPIDDKGRMENGMKALYEYFQLAPELGSLLDPKAIKSDTYTANFEQLQPVLKKALEIEADNDVIERGVMAAGIAKAGDILSKSYNLIITNVPFLGRNKQSEILFAYTSINFSSSKADLATIFIEKFRPKLSQATIAVVTPQNWLFLGTYKEFRTNILKNNSLNLIARLGPKGFRTTMWDFNVMLIILSGKQNSEEYYDFDVSSFETPELKSNALKVKPLEYSKQVNQLENPDSRIIIGEIATGGSLLSAKAEAYQGLITGDRNSYIFKFWELSAVTKDWEYFSDSFSKEDVVDGKDSLIFWQKGKGRLCQFAALNRDRLHDMHESGQKSWGKKGVLVTRIGLKVNPYYGEKYDNNLIAITPKNEDDLKALYIYIKSNKYKESVRKLDQKLSLTNATVLKVNSFSELNIDGNAFPELISNEISQWAFHGSPTQTENPLQASISRLLGYRWPAESDADLQLASEAKILIDQLRAFDNLSDDDGIFCIPSVNSEQAGSDRLRSYLQEVFVREWNNQTVKQLLAKEKANSSNLEDWLSKEFFIQHCKGFQNRPFIWHIWDGRSDGFSALVNYHKLNKENLSKLIYTYLGDWIRVCEAKRKSGESGAEGLLGAAFKLKEKLEAILEGETPYDIFVRWKPIEQQPIGWEPDLNDGVRINIRPFIEAGVLRKNPNIKWGVDRGKNPLESPWGEKRDNNIHLSLKQKRESRKTKGI